MHSALKHFTRHFKEPCSCRQKSLSATYQQQKLSQVWERERKPNHRCFKIFSVPGPVLCITLMPCLCGGNHSNFALKNALASFCKVNVNSICIEKGTGVCTQSSCCPTHTESLRKVCLYLSLGLANVTTLPIWSSKCWWRTRYHNSELKRHLPWSCQ